MIHPSYKDLMNAVNADVEQGEEPVVNSRYSIVIATAKRARQIIDGAEPLVTPKNERALSIAVDEIYEGKVKILTAGDKDSSSMEASAEETAIDDVIEGLEDVEDSETSEEAADASAAEIEETVE